MNIEESIKIINGIFFKQIKDIEKTHVWFEINYEDTQKLKQAMETILTAYEEEKEENEQWKKYATNDLENQITERNNKIFKLESELEKEREENKRAEELYMQHNQMIINILQQCDYMIKNRFYMNDTAIRQNAEKIKDIAKYYIKEPEWKEE